MNKKINLKKTGGNNRQISDEGQGEKAMQSTELLGQVCNLGFLEVSVWENLEFCPGQMG